MAVKMQWDETLYRDDSRVVLEITNITTQYTMNVTSAGLYIDWMRLSTFETNTSSFLLEPNQRKAVNIFFRVPVDARLGKHSDYILIEYTINNGTNGTWNKGTFESTINKDFSVVERPAPKQDGWPCRSPIRSASPGWWRRSSSWQQWRPVHTPHAAGLPEAGRASAQARAGTAPASSAAGKAAPRGPREVPHLRRPGGLCFCGGVGRLGLPRFARYVIV